MREQTKTRKNENRLPFFHFSFYARTKGKTEKRKSTSVLSFFVLCVNKQKNGKTKIDFRFIVFRFMREQTRERKKRKSTSVLSFSVLCTKKREPRVWDGCRYQPYCRGRVYRRREGGVVLAKRIVVVVDENAARDLPALSFVSGSD